VGAFWTGALLLSSSQPEKALKAYQESIRIFDRASTAYFGAAAAAFAVHRPDLAQQYLVSADRYCRGCAGLYRAEATRALMRGDSATADSLFARARRIDKPPQ
jgi:tetratricopeptide (TPR) repeat protein